MCMGTGNDITANQKQRNTHQSGGGIEGCVTAGEQHRLKHNTHSLEQQISEDHVTLKTAGMMLKIQL